MICFLCLCPCCGAEENGKNNGVSYLFLFLSILYAAWTVGLILMILLFAMLPRTAYIASIICLNIMCVDLFFRSLVAQSMLRDNKLNCVDLFFRSLDMASLNCLLRIVAVQFHLILVALSFSLTISYPFYLNSTMRDIAICAICVAHLSYCEQPPLASVITEVLDASFSLNILCLSTAYSTTKTMI